MAQSKLLFSSPLGSNSDNSEAIAFALDSVGNVLFALSKLIGVHATRDTIFDVTSSFLSASVKTTQQGLWDLIDLLFSPKQVLKQLMLVIVIQVSLLFGAGLGRLGYYAIQSITATGRKLRIITMQMERCGSYAEWRRLAEEDDHITGAERWRLDDVCPFYDVTVIKRRIKGCHDRNDLHHLVIVIFVSVVIIMKSNSDVSLMCFLLRVSDIQTMVSEQRVFDLIFRLRGGLSRDVYGIQNEGLYTKARAGTKFIVEQYHETVVDALNYIADENDCNEDVRAVSIAVIVLQMLIIMLWCLSDPNRCQVGLLQ